MSVLTEWWIWLILIVCWGIGFSSVFEKNPLLVILMSLVIIFIFRGLIFGIIGVIRNQSIHIEIKDGGLGFGSDAADFWLFTDGIRQIRRNFWGTTTIRHHNGTIIDIPTEILSNSDLSILRAGMEKYHSTK